MTSLREELNEAGFNWAKGQIVAQWNTFATNGPPIHRYVAQDEAILDDPHACLSFVAKDDKAIFFNSQYDGSLTMERVELDLNFYLDPEHPTPCPGG